MSKVLSQKGGWDSKEPGSKPLDLRVNNNYYFGVKNHDVEPKSYENRKKCSAVILKRQPIITWVGRSL